MKGREIGSTEGCRERGRRAKRMKTTKTSARRKKKVQDKLMKPTAELMDRIKPR